MDMNASVDGVLYNQSHDVGSLASGMVSSTGDGLEELGYGAEVMPVEAAGAMSVAAPSSEASSSSMQDSDPSRLTPHITHVTAPSSTDASSSAPTMTAQESLMLETGSTVSFSGGISHSTPLSRPLTLKEQELLSHLDRLKFFLATAPSRWSESEGGDDNVAQGWNGIGAGRIQRGTPMMPHPNMHPALNRFLLPSGECSSAYISCAFGFLCPVFSVIVVALMCLVVPSVASASNRAFDRIF